MELQDGANRHAHIDPTTNEDMGRANAENAPRRRTYTRVSGSIDVSTFRQLQSTIDILTDTIQRGEQERNQLMATIKAFQHRTPASSAPRDAEFGMSVTSNSNSMSHSGVHSHSNVHRDPNAPPQPRGRSITPQRRGSAQRGVSPNGTRSISPSAAYQRIHSVFSQNRGGSGEGGGTGFTTVSDQWRLAYHGNPNEDLNSITHKKLLADNRAMIQMIDNLQREQRKAESEYESRLRRMQRTLTDTTERYSAVTERAALMEIQLKEVQKKLRPGARSEVLNSQFTRTLSSYKNGI